MKYDSKKIEKKWQLYWEKNGTYRQYQRPKKQYILDMFPYPSGVGLHVGHPKGYIASDVYARLKQLQGYGVIHPMGWDAFGLPAEQYAIKNKVHPSVAVKENITTFKKQLQKIGFTYDWEREINTTDPEYYRWTQWIFLQLWKKGLAYESYDPINWCPSCQTGLSNEDLEQGRCERCGSVVEKRPMRQWVLRITAYADKMLRDLKKLDWPEGVKEAQRNWIGRSEGVEVVFYVANTEEEIRVFTTRLDTIYGCTYVVVAPEHPLVKRLEPRIKNGNEMKEYLAATKRKTDLERTELNKDKTGILLQGIEVIHPFTGERLPIYVADYVLATYGNGAVMGVPAHDERDSAFAKKYGLEIRQSIENMQAAEPGEVFIEDGRLVNSKEFTGLTSAEAREKMVAWLKKEKLGKKVVNYKMREWVFSRQRYWGEPIPLIHCEQCGVVPVPEKDLPVKLPNVKSYEPTGTGESPLAGIAKWVNVKCPVCHGPAKRETNTMPQWAGSCWYYLRFIDPKNTKALVDKKKEKVWIPVDVYVGGDHATRHLIYARFWHKFLYDQGVVSTSEPFSRLEFLGLILAADGRKMSKRWGNVINPDDVIAEFGADAFRIYEMFMGPFEQSIAWNTNGVVGTRRFLEKTWKLQNRITEQELPSKNKNLGNLLHKTIKKVTEDIEAFKFNTAVSSLMILVNEFEKDESVYRDSYRTFLILLAPFAPHITEELWSKLGEKQSIFLAPWPKYNPKLASEETKTIGVQVNGKVRSTIELALDTSEAEAKVLALADAKIKALVNGKKVQKFIYVPGRILNFVLGE